jgi:Zn-dependent M28 family amino/carboxypeptidase
MKRFAWTALVPTFLIAGPLAAQDAPKPSTAQDSVPDVVKGITARELGGHMKFLASDLMRGRDTASPEIRLAAEYLASRLFAAGAVPSGDADGAKTSYFQKFPIETFSATQEGTTLSFDVNQNGTTKSIPLTLGTDVTFNPRGVTPGEVVAPVVFAGYGVVNPETKVDDYEGLDVTNRFVIVYAGQPPAPPKEAVKGEEKVPEKTGEPVQPKAPVSTRIRQGMANPNLAKVEPALKRGALGVIIVQSPQPGSARPAPAIVAGRPVPGFGRGGMTLGITPATIPAFTVTEAIRDQLFQAAAFDSSNLKPRLLEGVQAKFNLVAKKELKEDRNVIGYFPGSDPEKSKEVVIFSAHYDHVGVDAKGVIFNGSDDNASGTSSLLEIAEAFGDGPKPARTVAFLWVSGEEKGLWGSEWFSNHISLPEGFKIVADINIDMVSRNDGKSIGMTPSEKHPSHSNLATMAVESAAAEGLEVKYDADQFFGRTDSANFARKGIPVVFFFSGIHEDYHKSTDDVEKADFDKAARVARSAYRLGWLTAQAPEPPKRTKAE